MGVRQHLAEELVLVLVEFGVAAHVQAGTPPADAVPSIVDQRPVLGDRLRDGDDPGVDGAGVCTLELREGHPDSLATARTGGGSVAVSTSVIRSVACAQLRRS